MMSSGNSASSIAIAMQTYAPAATECARRNKMLVPTPHGCKETGFQNQLLDLILSLCNVSYTLHPLTSDEVGSLVNDSYTEGMALVENGTLDMFNTQWVVTESRLKHFHFGFMNSQFRMVLIGRRHPARTINVAWRIFAGFQPSVYLLFFASIFAILLLLIMIARLSTLSLRKPTDFFMMILSGKMNMFNHHIRHHMASRRVAIAIWGLLLIISLNLYQGVLLTRLFKTSRLKSFGLDQLVEKLEKGQVTLIEVSLPSFFYENLYQSTSANYRRLRKAIGDRQIEFRPDAEEALDLVAAGRHVIRTSFHQGIYLTMNRCDTQIVRLEGFSQPWETYMLSKKSKLNLPLFIQRHIEVAGYQENVEHQYRRMFKRWKARICAEEQGNGFKVQKLSLNYMVGCFGILCVGFIAAVCVFGWEMATGPPKRNNLKSSHEMQVQSDKEKLRAAFDDILSRVDAAQHLEVRLRNTEQLRHLNLDKSVISIVISIDE